MQKWSAWSERMRTVINKTAGAHRCLNDYGI